MSKLTWDQTGDRLYETGVDRGVLYPESSGTYPKGIAWNGLTGFTESPSGADATTIYADNIKYLTLRAAEDYGATITAYTYPDEWEECDGSASPVPGVTFGQQKRKMFGFSCRTLIGNDTESDSHGYKLHLVYAATASPSERAYSTVNDSPEAIEFSWEISTTPIAVATTDSKGGELKPVACLTIDSTKVDSTKMKALEDILYGGTETEARLPLPDEVVNLLKAGG